MNNDTLLRKAIYVWYIIGLLLLFYITGIILMRLKAAVTILVLAILIVYALYPFYLFFRKRGLIFIYKKGISHIWAVTVVVSLFVIFTGLLLAFIIPKIISESNKFIKEIPTIINTISKQVIENAEQHKGFFQRIPQNLRKRLVAGYEEVLGEVEKYILSLVGKSYSFAVNVASVIAAAVIIPFLAFFILLDFAKLYNAFLCLIPEDKRLLVKDLIRNINEVMLRFVIGQLSLCLSVGIIMTSFLLICRMDYAYLMGAFAGITYIIPYIGAALGMIPPLVDAMFKSPIYALVIFIGMLGIHQAIGHALVPVILGHRLGLSSFIILIALLIGFELLGVFGMIISVPMVAVFKVLIKIFYQNNMVIKESN